LGRRTQTETLSKLLVAFLEEPVWKQTDLARRCGVGARALRTRIQDLCEAGIPIDREEDHPHVYYSVPTGWFPGRGTGVEKLDHLQIARLLGRLPHTAAREQILARLVSTAFGSPTVASDAPADVTDRVLDVLEDAVKRSMPVRMGYYSASRGEHSLRTVSIQRMAYGTPTRFVAFCHRSSKLKWFRADRVTSPELDASATFRQVAPRDVGAFVASSLDGFSAGDATTCSFLVREAESHWVLRTLPAGAVATVHQERGGARATLRTSGVEILARFLTGLGGIVSEIEPSSLRLRVQALAREALAASSARLSRHSARPIQSAG
jgi:predicted DNA-binding transcriptional regulator YafY